MLDRLRVIVAAAATADPARFDLRPHSVAVTGEALIATMIDALPAHPGSAARHQAIRPARSGGQGRREKTGNEDLVATVDQPGEGNQIEGGQRDASSGDGGGWTVAGRLWGKLTGVEGTPGRVAGLNAALVLLADHGFAASSMAARVVASAHANPYAVVAAGISGFEGPLHGASAARAYQLIADAADSGDPAGSYERWLRTGGYAFDQRPGQSYPQGDVRASTLLGLLAETPEAVTRLISLAQPGYPTIEFVLAAFAHSAAMGPDATEAIFVIARTAGWLAHAIEEYQEKEMRFRIRMAN
jgi:citrate synthase